MKTKTKVILTIVAPIILIVAVHQTIEYYNNTSETTYTAPIEIMPIKSDIDIKFENTRKLVERQMLLLENVKDTEETLNKVLAIHGEVVAEYCDGMNMLDMHSPATTRIYNELSDIAVECD